ncbi:hypothetical protein GCM10009111_23440 [Colwellia asteriadis]|uniref:Uncharacterized protein n=1 Tax=Colwellia asteriadis TaxID=517723 RepID=A0ABN1L893_9GAMM
MPKEQFLTVRINDKCEPLDRGDIYEDPLDEALQKESLGEVTGGGSQLNENYKIEYCELEVTITGELEKTKQFIINELNKIGIPKGSKLIHDNVEIEFGNKEIMAVCFSNILADEVYEKNDINDVLEEFDELLGEDGEMANHTEIDDETIVYFKGTSFAKMQKAINEYFTSNELCTNGRILQET